MQTPIRAAMEVFDLAGQVSTLVDLNQLLDHEDYKSNHDILTTILRRLEWKAQNIRRMLDEALAEDEAREDATV